MSTTLPTGSSFTVAPVAAFTTTVLTEVGVGPSRSPSARRTAA